MQNLPRNLTLALVSSLALIAAGCDSKPKDSTAGQKLDSAIADVKQETREAGDTMERKADQMGQAIDDAAITASVKAKLIAADDLKGLDISVDTKDGVVALTGKVANASARNHALALVNEVDGVIGVSDGLTIK